MEQKLITIIGSYNVGLFLKGQKIPSVGETVIGDIFYEGGGGKGSNQAIAASLLGADTFFLGCIGNDKYGENALGMYKKLGISTKMIKVDNSIHTGISVIMVDKYGNNSICVVPGANFKLSKKDIDKALKNIKDSWIVGFQLENNLNVIEYAIKKVHGMGIKTILDPAPAKHLPEDIYEYLWCIKPNEIEATALTGIEVKDIISAEKAGRWFVKRGVNIVIITLGDQGAVLIQDKNAKHFPTPKVEAIDTTGAGDCFSGALMAALSQDKNIEEAIEFANYAAAISVTKQGVIESLPYLSEVKSFMNLSRNKIEKSVYDKKYD